MTPAPEKEYIITEWQLSDFLPVKMPINCQGMTPLGGTEK